MYIIQFMDMRFSLRQMMLFTEIAQQGSLSAAAASLAMSQSAASTALIELEGRYQCALFERIGRRLRLSTAGHALLPVAINLLGQAELADAVLRGRTGPGPLALGATQTIGAHVAPRLIADYRHAHPESKVSLTIANTAQVIAGVEGFALDMGLIEGQADAPGLTVTRWLEDRLVLIVRAGHALAGAGVSIDDLLGARWVVREPGSGTRQALDRAMEPYVDRWTIDLELQQPQAIVGMVAASELIGCVSRLAAEAAIARGQVVALDVPALDLARRFYIIRRGDRQASPAVAAMLEMCGGVG